MSNYSDYFGGGAVPLWVSGTTYGIGKVLRSPVDLQLYTRRTSGSGTTDPSADATNYYPEGARASKPIQSGIITIANAAASGTATIATVVPGKCRLSMLGASETGIQSSPGVYLVLTSATVITATRLYGAGTAANVVWQLEESL